MLGQVVNYRNMNTADEFPLPPIKTIELSGRPDLSPTASKDYPRSSRNDRQRAQKFVPLTIFNRYLLPDQKNNISLYKIN